MKHITWDNPNKMHIDTGYKLFDRQTNCISYGNVYANTQSSSYIRPYMETECNGREFKPGELMKFDLKCVFGEYLKDYNLIPQAIKRVLENKDRKQSVVLYKFFVTVKKERRVIGFVLADYDNNLIERCAIDTGNRSHFWKRYKAVLEASKYICNDDED